MNHSKPRNYSLIHSLADIFIWDFFFNSFNEDNRFFFLNPVSQRTINRVFVSKNSRRSAIILGNMNRKLTKKTNFNNS